MLRCLSPRAWLLAVLACTGTLSACGGGGGGSSPSIAVAPTSLPQSPATPLPTPSGALHAAPTAAPGVSAVPSPGSSPSTSPAPSKSPGAIVGPQPTLRPVQTGPNGGWGPYAVANAFAFPVQSGFNGTGMTIAIVNDYPPSTSDTAAYLAQFGIQHTGSFTIKNVDGGSPHTDQSGLFEATLDLETIEALAPGANVVFYATPDLSTQSLIDAYNQILSDGNVNVVNMSYGGCESSVGVSAEDPLFAQGASQGIAFVAASGDTGDECFNSSGTQVGVNYPASDPNVIGVGGTQTATITCQMGDITSQQAFNDTCRSGGSQEATGGGPSAVFSLPSYQAAIGVSGRYRNVPDIAMPAVFSAMVLQGTWILADGTSWSSPQIAALMAELYEFCEGPLQNPVQVFYQAFSLKQYADFTPVTSGNNQYAGDSTFYTANGGFSDVTGIGVPFGMLVANDVCPSRTPSSLGRASRGVTATATRGPAKAVSQSAPGVRGLLDTGPRTQNASTRVVVVLRPTATVADDEQTVAKALATGGFQITKTYANHLVIDAEAPASVVASYFQTQISDFTQGSFGSRYANVTPLIIPASIAPYVQSVIADDVVSAITE